MWKWYFPLLGFGQLQPALHRLAFGECSEGLISLYCQPVNDHPLFEHYFSCTISICINFWLVSDLHSKCVSGPAQSLGMPVFPWGSISSESNSKGSQLSYQTNCVPFSPFLSSVPSFHSLLRTWTVNKKSRCWQEMQLILTWYLSSFQFGWVKEQDLCSWIVFVIGLTWLT